METKFLILGGDGRFVNLSNILGNEGYNVKVYGLDKKLLSKDVTISNDLYQTINDADVVIGPLPISLDDETINITSLSEKVNLVDIFKGISKNQIFFGGFISEKVHQLANAYDINLIDYYDREELVILNCIPTAEGAIQIAMQELPVTIHDSKCLVLGYGRIGKILSKMLHGIGAKVYVEARKLSDLAYIQSFGYEGIHINDLAQNINSFDIIFNTIPSLILDKKFLKKVNTNCLIIDLASKPGGIDFEAAKDFGIKAIWALSLPGKVAPYTAGNIIKNTIFNILDELGV